MLGERLRQLREARNWSQAGLARLSQVPQQYISKIEQGRTANVGIETLSKLAGAFALTVDQLLNGETPVVEQPPLAELIAVGWSDARLHELEELWPYQSPAERAAFRREVARLLAEHRALESALEAARQRKQTQPPKAENGEQRPAPGGAGREAG